MTWGPPDKVLLTGGHSIGGLTSFAEALSSGFGELGVPAEVIKPSRLLSRIGDLRNDRKLKVLSTTGILAAPLSKRAICVSHGVPLAREQGWGDLFGLVGCYKLANACRNSRLVTVSDYAAIHLKYIFNVRVDAVIRVPLANLFFEPFAEEQYRRQYVTFVGRLVEVKRLDLLLPPICDLLRENPNLHCCIVGDGPYRKAWEESVAGTPRVEFVGSRNPVFIREQLRRSKIFISGAGNETLGTVYLEALSQGCIVAMPATGGGIEISLQSVGESIQLLPIALDRKQVLAVLRRALKVRPSLVSLDSFSPRSIASAYLDLDRTFFERAAPALGPVTVNNEADVARILH